MGKMAWFPSGQREQTVNLPVYAFDGSNPSHATIVFVDVNAGVAQLVEHQPSKLGVASSNLVARSILEWHIIFQSLVTSELSSRGSVVEYFLGKEEVTSSNLVASSISSKVIRFFLLSVWAE
jgi:hypothetical protein